MAWKGFSSVCTGRLFRAFVLALAVLGPVPWALAQAADRGPVGMDAPVTKGRASLTVHILGVSPKGGIVRLGVYDAAGYPNSKGPVVSADVPAHPGETVIHFSDLAPGTYAIEVYQDINDNGRMDQTWIGLPLEPYGFSRDARPLFSKPDFAQVSFAVKAGHNEQTLHLQNVGAPGT